jgi:hypothetical protein
VYGERNNLHWFSKIGRIENLGAGTDLPPPSPYRLRPFNSEFAALRNRRAAGNTEFTLAHGILDVFEKSSFMNNAQLHSWAINEQHNEKEIT